jgi:Gdp/GTP exchange factor required for growth at low temperatures
VINSFGTLVAVMHGLQSDWVRRAMSRHYQQLPLSDHRIHDALVRWVASEGDFKFIKQQVESVKNRLGGRPHASSISVTSDGINPVNVDPPAGCVPFIGRYLSIRSDIKY